MPTHRKSQAEGSELREGLHPQGSASDGPAGDNEAREKTFFEPVVTVPALGFRVWRFATFLTPPLPRITLHLAAGRQRKVGVMTSSFRWKNSGTLKEVEAGMASPQSVQESTLGTASLPGPGILP